MTDDCCSICAGTTEGQLTTLDCGHVMHVRCVLEWFRYHHDTCPNCRATESRERWTRKTPRERVSVIRRRKNLSPDMRRLVQQLDRAREAQQVAQVEHRSFVTMHSDVLRERTRLESKLHHCRARECTLVRRVYLEGTDAPYLTFDGEDSGEDANL